jgi:CRISPR-associated protein (TIGR02710 family)
MDTILFITVGGSPAPIYRAVDTIEPDRVIFICSSGPKGSVTQVTGSGKPCENRKITPLKVNLDTRPELPAAVDTAAASSSDGPSPEPPLFPTLLEQLGIADTFQPKRDTLMVSSSEKQPNLVTQLGLTERFDEETDLVLLDNPDDLAECFRQISEAIRATQQTEPNSTLCADYTGGTKTMSLSLGMAALDYGLTLYLTTNATRENLIKVERGETTERTPTTLVTVERTLNQEIPKFLQDFNYAGAISTLQYLLKTLELPPEQKRRVRQLRDVCAGLDAWDRFDHLTAYDLISMHQRLVPEHGLALKRVLSSRAAIDDDFHPSDSIKGHGYELVEDLLLNAQRRAHQQRYDDAVGRLYRALELLAQIRLKEKYKIQTGDLDVEKLPEALREKYVPEAEAGGEKKIQLALQKSYTLLSELNDDLLGDHYQSQANPLKNALKVRNYSLFAHGFKPVTASDYQEFGRDIQAFIETGLEKLIPAEDRKSFPQFPTGF